MTESEWLACDDPQRMVAWLETATESVRTRWHGVVQVVRWRISERKCWLLAVEARRAFLASLNLSHWDDMLDTVADWADGKLTAPQRDAQIQTLMKRERECADFPVLRSTSFGMVVVFCQRTSQPFDGDLLLPLADAEGAALVREIVGNPFRPVVLVPDWLAYGGGTVRQLAEALAASRDRTGLPVLADALEEAGCTQTDLLDHLRSPGPHVRSCWALDAVLGMV